MILVYLEQQGERLPKSSLVAITAALQLKSAHGYQKAVGVLVGGADVNIAAQAGGKYGLDEICVIESPAAENYLSQPFAEAIVAAARDLNATAVIGVATARGKDFLPRVAQALGAGLASDCTAVLSDGKLKRPIFAGNLFATVEVLTPVKVMTFRSSAFDGPAASESSSPVRKLSISMAPPSQVQFVRFETVKSERPELTEAEIVVSGGRAVQSADNFQSVVLPLADVLGAAVGASRAAVDSGYAPNDWQVGQTGKVVAPKLYVAVGISGAIQHLAGMKDSKTIVAINKDPEAPIFEVADYGLVADLFEAVPQLTEKIKAIRSS